MQSTHAELMEAAKRLRGYMTGKEQVSDVIGLQLKLADAMLAELDETPITRDLLRELGFHLEQQDRCDWWSHPNHVIVSANQGVLAARLFAGRYATTAGQLRTLLRLASVERLAQGN